MVGSVLLPLLPGQKIILTTTEHAFVPGHLSRLTLGPGQKVAFVPGPTASRASGGGG